MTLPQLENGYTKIANRIIEELSKFRIPGEQWQCLLVIIRKTYGFGKKEDRISNSQFCEATGLRKGNVCRAIKELSKKKLVIKSENNSHPTYRFNKDSKDWLSKVRTKKVIKKATKVIKSENDLLSKVRNTKEIKETLQNKPPIVPQNDPVPLPDFFTDEVSSHYRKHRTMMADLGCPLHLYQEEANILQLTKFHKAGMDLETIILYSIGSRHKTFFPEKGNGNGKQGGNGGDTEHREPLFTDAEIEERRQHWAKLEGGGGKPSIKP